MPAVAASAADILKDLKTRRRHVLGSNREPIGERDEDSAPLDPNNVPARKHHVCALTE